VWEWPFPAKRGWPKASQFLLSSASADPDSFPGECAVVVNCSFTQQRRQPFLSARAHPLAPGCRYPRLEPRDADCAAKLKKRTLTNLYNERPAWLDLAHKKLDAAVAAAYGWPVDLSDEQILERLLALNLERAAEEAKAQESPKRKSAQRYKTEHELI